MKLNKRTFQPCWTSRDSRDIMQEKKVLCIPLFYSFGDHALRESRWTYNVGQTKCVLGFRLKFHSGRQTMTTIRALVLLKCRPTWLPQVNCRMSLNLLLFLSYQYRDKAISVSIKPPSQTLAVPVVHSGA